MTNAEPTFSAAQRADLLCICSEEQVARLEATLPSLGHYLFPKPPAPEMRDLANRLLKNAYSDVAELEAALKGHSAARKQVAAMWAFYMDCQPRTVRVDPPRHADPASVIERELASARHRAWAAEQIIEDTKGQRQHEASATAVGLLVSALNGAPGPKINVSTTEGTPFMRLVGICMAAAGGNDDSYERWVKNYKKSLTAESEEPDFDDADVGRPIL